MQRPGNVPKSARYSSDGWWEVGDVKKGRPFGPWKAYRSDGSPLFDARFDGKGRLQGTYKRFHPDGTLAREATYAEGVPTGRTIYLRAKGAEGDVFPCGDPRVWQVIVHHDKHGRPGKRELLDGKGREVVAGAPVAEAALDAVFATAQPDGFLATDALATVAKSLPAAPPPERDDFLIEQPAPAHKPLDAARFADLYGRPMPAGLRAWLDAPPVAWLGIRAVRDADIEGADNQIEALILEHQAAPGRASMLRELVSGTVAIGEHGDHRYALAICETLFDANVPDAVYAISPSADAMAAPVARTLDDFAYAIALISAAETGGVSLGGLRPAYQRLRGRVALRAPMTTVEARALGDDEDDETVGDPQGDHREGFHFRRGQKIPVYFFFRCRWLLRLLRGHAEGAAADFDPKLDGGLDDKRFELIRGNAPKEPWVAFYWLFRSWVFDDARLDTLLRACSDTPSRLVRDVARLVGEIASGRKQLGAVDDLHAVKARFRALDPLAKKPESDDEEADEEEAAPPPSLASSVPAELAPAAAVLDWARGNGYMRENLMIKDEVDAAALGLALGADPRIVAEIAKMMDDSPWLAERFLDPWLDGDRANLAELVPQARAWMDSKAGGSVYRWTVASRILARVGERDDAALIANVLEPAFDSFFGRGQGFDSAMALMVLQEAVGPMSEALATLGVPAGFVPALEGVCAAETHLVDDARGDCALALASAGVGLDAIVAGVRGQIAKKHGHRIGAGQLLAIGMLGRDRGGELAELIAEFPRIGDEAKVAQAIALRDLGRDIDAVAAVRDGLAKRRYSNTDTRKQRVFLLGLVAKRRDLPAELAVPYVLDDEVLVHRAAVRALRAHGAPVPATNVYDPMRVAAMSRDDIHAALADDRGIYRSNLALWLGDNPDPSSREPLAVAARRLAADKDFPKEGPRHYELRWIVRALLAIGGADNVLDELLRNSNDNVAEPVLRYPDRITIGMVRGMANVFANGKHWKQSVAKQWLAKHKQDPAIARALAEHGLAVEDVSKEDA
jgi:hypothetical protein